MQIRILRYAPLAIAAIIVLMIIYASMMLLYGLYYVQPNEYTFINIVTFLILGSCVALWVLFPSRLVVGFTIVVCSLSPGIYMGMPIIEQLNPMRLAILLISVCLAVGIAHWCQKIKSGH